MTETPAAPAATPDGVRQTPDGRTLLTALGRDWELPGLDLEDYPLLRDRLAERRRHPLAAAVADLDEVPPEVRDLCKKELFDRAYADLLKPPEDRVPAAAEVSAWISTDAGAAYSLFLMVRKKASDVTEEQAVAILTALGRARFLKLRDAASQRLIEDARRRQGAGSA